MKIIIYILGVGAALYFLYKRPEYKKPVTLMLVFSLMAVGMAVVFMVKTGSAYLDTVERKDKGEGELLLDMEVEAFDSKEDYEAGKGSKKEIKLNLASLDYSPEELISMEKRLWKELYPQIKGENESLDNVDKPLNFPSGVQDYPFEISYSSSKMKVLGNDGEIGIEAPSEGELVEINAIITLPGSDFEAREVFYARVFPAADEASFWKRLSKQISQREEESRSGRTYRLPLQFEGKYISYSKKITDNSSLIFILGIIAAAALISADKRNEEKRTKERMDAMEAEYPGMVSKMSMLVGAGLTISGAFKKLAADYGKSGDRDKPLYQEMLKTAREVESGISEKKAWQNMGNRCRMPCIVRFCALIVQYNQSGASGLKAALGAETDQALKERRERAKRLGEEAGTKLLVPMVLMLLVVMVIIMIPAFASFGI